MQALNAGDTLTDTVTVTTVDGTPQVVKITINGSNDFDYRTMLDAKSDPPDHASIDHHYAAGHGHELLV